VASTRLIAVRTVAAAVLLAGCGADEQVEGRGAGTEPVDPAYAPGGPRVSPDGPVTLPLEDTAGLGLDGKVTLTSAGPERTDIGVQLDAPADTAFSASIREGSCDEPEGVVHDLGVVEPGASNLVADAPLVGVLAPGRVFVLTAAEGEGVVACADLPDRVG
jgi:hypothetical protein